MEVYWNTGRKYTANGQRISAVLMEDNKVIFRDHDRGISGVVTVQPLECFPLRTKEALKTFAFNAYNSNDYEYDLTGRADKLEYKG